MTTNVINTHINLPALGRGERKKWSFISLLFSFFYFVPLFMNDPAPSSSHLLASIGIYAAFIGFYIWSVFSSARAVILPITCLLVACIVGTLLNFGGLFLFGFVAFLIGYHAHGWQRVLVLLVLIASMVATVTYYGAINWAYVIPPIFTCLALCAFGLLERKEAFLEIHKQHAASELAEVSAIAERERIGRDLHDLVGHSLSSIALKAELAEKLLKHDRIDEAKTQLAELSAVSREVLSDVRKAVSGMKKLSLKSELQALATQLENASIEVSFNTHKLDITKLSVETELQMAFVAKEAVTNILRHSNAKKAYIRAYTEDHIMTLHIGDNGSANKAEAINEKTSNGLAGMRERLSIISGSLNIEQHEGLHIQATAPLS